MFDATEQELEKVQAESGRDFMRYVKSVALAEHGEEPLVTDHQARMLFLTVQLLPVISLHFSIVKGVTHSLNAITTFLFV